MLLSIWSKVFVIRQLGQKGYRSRLCTGRVTDSPPSTYFILLQSFTRVPTHLPQRVSRNRMVSVCETRHLTRVKRLQVLGTLSSREKRKVRIMSGSYSTYFSITFRSPGLSSTLRRPVVVSPRKSTKRFM